MTGRIAAGPAVVTGASGFLGRHLVAALLAAGRPVQALCRNPAPLAPLAGPRLSLRCGDIADPAVYRDLLRPETSVFHLAAVRVFGVRNGLHHRVNVEATVRLAEAALAAGVRRFVHLSTALAFGSGDGIPRSEAGGYDPSPAAGDAYLASRIEAARRLRLLGAAGLPLVIVSPAIVYGPDHPSRPNRVTAHIRRLRRWPVSVLLAGGAAPRSLVYVEDVVGGILAAEAAPVTDVVEEFIIAGEPVAPREFDRLVRRLAGRPGLAVPVPGWAAVAVGRLADRLLGPRSGGSLETAVRRLATPWSFDASKARRLLGFRPTPLEEGVRRTLATEARRRASVEGVSRAGQRWRWEEVARSMRDFSAAPSTRYYRRREQDLIAGASALAGRRVLKLDLWNEAINTRILNWMRQEGARVTGLDWSGIVAARARRNSVLEDGRPLPLTRGDIRELPFADASFDLVYTMGTIEHIAEYRQAVAEVGRVLAAGGTAIIGVPHRWNLFLRPLLVWLLELAGLYPYAPERSFGAGELRRIVEAAGLAVRERTGILAIPGSLRMLDLLLHTRGRTSRRLIPALLRPFEALEERSRWARRRLGYLLVLVADKPAARHEIVSPRARPARPRPG